MTYEFDGLEDVLAAADQVAQENVQLAETVHQLMIYQSMHDDLVGAIEQLVLKQMQLEEAIAEKDFQIDQLKKLCIQYVAQMEASFEEVAA